MTVEYWLSMAGLWSVGVTIAVTLVWLYCLWKHKPIDAESRVAIGTLAVCHGWAVVGLLFVLFSQTVQH